MKSASLSASNGVLKPNGVSKNTLEENMLINPTLQGLE